MIFIFPFREVPSSAFMSEPERALEQPLEQPLPNTVGELVYEAPRVRQQMGARTDNWVQPNVPSASFAYFADAYTRYLDCETF